MQLNHNQYAIAAIVATLCLAGLYTVVDAMLSTSQSVGYYEPAADDIFLDESETQMTGQDFDNDGIPDRMEQTSMAQTGSWPTRMEMGWMTGGR